MDLDNAEVHMCHLQKHISSRGIKGVIDDHVCIKQTSQRLKSSNGDDIREERKREYAEVKGVVYNKRLIDPQN